MPKRLGRNWGGISRINLDEVFNGDVWLLTENEDFAGKVTTARTRLHGLANARDLKLRTRVEEQDDGRAGLVIQAYTPTPRTAS